MKSESSTYYDPIYDLGRPFVTAAPRELLPAEFRDLCLDVPRERIQRKGRTRRLWLGLLAAAKRRPLMGILALRTDR